jgi:hypothetical protein
MNAKNILISGNGFPGTNKTLRFIQDSHAEPIGALASLLGNTVIVSGCVVDAVANTISNGFICIDAKIIPFIGGTLATTITLDKVVENGIYNLDVNNDQQLDSLPVYEVITARCGTGGFDIYNLADFVPLETIKSLTPLKAIVAALQVNDAAQQMSINALNSWVANAGNFLGRISALETTTASLTLGLGTAQTKLATIATGAEVNVQANWNENNAALDSYILNKPAVSSSYKTLYAGSVYIGNIFPSDITTVVSFPSIGTANYVVAGTLRSVGANFDNDNDVIWMVRSLYSTQFTLCLRELATPDQNLYFDYVLIQAF